MTSPVGLLDFFILEANDSIDRLDAAISGAYILDPWYPRVSSIWGASDGPGNFEDLAELERNWPVYQSPPVPVARFSARAGTAMQNTSGGPAPRAPQYRNAARYR